MKTITQEIDINGKKLELSTGNIARLAASSILARYGDTMVLATVATRKLPQDIGYMPLQVEYVERLYAGGRIKGSRWVKREGRPSDEAILTARLVDRSVRPLFPKDYRDEVQIILTVLSVDGENDPAILAGVASSAALAISGVPWDGPVAILRVGMQNGNYFVNPTDSEMDFSNLDLVLALKDESILMIEAGANEVPEEKIVGAIEYAKEVGKKITDGIRELADKVGTTKIPAKTKDKNLIEKIEKQFSREVEEIVALASKSEGGDVVRETVKTTIQETLELPAHDISWAFDEAVRRRVRAGLISGKRLDGRQPADIREINIEVGVLPRTHGSAIFTRGQTQVLNVTTLGIPGMEQLIEGPEGEETKRYMHHYSMPPFATGETGRVGSPNRREIGHGALAERALLPVIPSEDKFPYAVRVVSEIMSSNGSTSMASVCGSALSLMDAGVPITKPVAGIAMGLVVNPSVKSKLSKYIVLSDITGIEDGSGDMDFKVAGTRDGITALQLDVKTKDLILSVLKEALDKALAGRLFILDKIEAAISTPRASLSVYAPRVVVVHVPQEKIGEVIGPGGRVIRRIMAETGAQVDVEDDGTVNISGVSDDSVGRAKAIIEGLTKEVARGEEYQGTVKRIQPFGAFVEILPGKEGLVHISDMSSEYVNDPHDVVSEGQNVRVWVKEIDDLGRLNLTMKEVKPGQELQGRPRSERRPPRQGLRQGRGGFSGRPPFRGGRGREDRREDSRRPSRAPHFPASRYLEREKKY